MVKKSWIAFALTIFPFLALFSLPSLVDLFSGNSEYAELLLNGREITRFYNQPFQPELLPESIYSDSILNKNGILNPNLGLEGLFLMPLSEDETADPLKVMNILCSVSTLKGLEYYSVSHDKMRVLFEQSNRIDNPEEDSVLEDLSFQQVPDALSFYIHQKDSTFGDSTSLLNLYHDNGVLLMEQVNQSPLRINGILRVIGPEKFQTRLLVIPCSEGWLYYGIMSADTLNINAFKERANKSFYNRMKALYGWFTGLYQSK